MGTQRTIGFFGATSIGVGAIVGGGILALAGTAFASAGPSAIIAFALNGFLAYITALSFAEMSAAFPESGGAYTFTKKVLSVRFAFAVGWILWLASIMAAVLYALGFASYALSALHRLWESLAGTAPAWISNRSMTIIFAVGATMFYTVKLIRKASAGGNWESVGKVIAFCILIIAGFWVFSKQPPNTMKTKFVPFFDGGLFGLLQAMGYTFITLQGFDLIAAMAGDIKNPRQNIPLSMFTSLGIALAVYLPFLFILISVGVPAGQSITSLSAMNPDTLVAVAVGNYLGPAGYWLIIFAAILAMLSALHANLLAASHIALAMSQDRTLPRFISVIHRESGVPIRALSTSSFFIIISLIMIPDLSSAGAAASLIFLISFTLVHSSAILARARGGAGDIVPSTSKFPLAPFIGLIACTLLASFQSITVPSAGRMLTIWLTGGFILYFFLLSGRAEVVDARTEARDPHLVRLRGRSPLVLVPLANPAHAKAMVEVANALSPPQVGRVLLLSVVAGQLPWEDQNPPPQLISSQDVLREALIASFRSDLSPEALITTAPHPWPEIERVARIHRCESLLIGLRDLSQNELDPQIEELVSQVDCDVVFLQAPSEWQLSNARRILVPVGGKGGHDELRARLLGSLCRSFEREITYLMIVSEDIPEKEYTSIQDRLIRLAGDEVPSHPRGEVVRSAEVVETVKKFAAKSDLVILGIQRLGRRKKVFGDIAPEIARATVGATILISRRG